MAHSVFALIYAGSVARLMVGTESACREAARELYGLESDVVNVTNIPVQEGDTYDGRFWRRVSGHTVEVKPLPSVEQSVAEIRATMADIDEAITELYELYMGVLA